MALITVDDLSEELVGFTISVSSRPSIANINDFIDEIESEVRAMWQVAGCTWPDADTPEAVYPKLTILLGTKYRFLDAKYTLSSAAMTPDSLAQARLAYNDRLKRISQVCVGVDDTAESSGPLVGITRQGMVSGSSFGEWTERHDRSLRRPFRPFGWRGFSGS